MSAQHRQRQETTRRSLSQESNSRMDGFDGPSQIAPYSAQMPFPPTPEFSPYLPPIYQSHSQHPQHYHHHYPSLSSSASTTSSASSSSSYRPSNSPPSLSLPPAHLPRPPSISSSTNSSSRAPTPSSRSNSTSTTAATKGKKTSGSGASTTKQVRESNRKANHSVIEKRRREKINAAMEELKELTSGHVLRASRERHGDLSEGELEGAERLDVGGKGGGGKGEFKLDVLEKTVQYIKSLHAHVESLQPHSPSQTQTPYQYQHQTHPPLAHVAHPPQPFLPSLPSSSSSAHASRPDFFSASSTSPTSPFNATTTINSSSNPSLEGEDVPMNMHTVDAATMLLSLASPELRGVVGGGLVGGGELADWWL